MPTDCLTDQAIALVAVASTERHCLHADTVRGISAQMNSRGLFHSSIHVNEVDKACAKELHTISSAAWDCLKRAHESCGRDQPARLLTLFLGIAEAETEKMERALHHAVGEVARHLQNKSMIPMREVSEARDEIVAKYRTEIDIYTANLGVDVGATFFDRWTHRVKNNRVLAFIAVVAVCLVGVASFSDAIGKLAAFAKGVFGDG